MKLTEKKLLRAIGEADEKTVEKAAPKLSTEPAGELRDFVPEMTESPEPEKKRIIRRITEIGVLCAAVALCVLAGFGISRMKRPAGGSNVRVNGGIDEARVFLASFAEDVKSGDTEKILGESLIEKMCELIPDAYDCPPEEYAEWYTEQWSSFFLIGYGTDEFEDILMSRQAISDRIEYLTMMYNQKGEPDKAEEAAKAEQPFLDFFGSIDEAYCFDIQFGSEDEPDSDDIEVFCIGGKWYAEPLDYFVPGLSDEAREELEEYRAQNKEPDDEPDETTTETEEPVDEVLIFELQENGYYVVDCINKEAESVRIPKTYLDTPVVGIECEVFSGCSKLKEITIPETVTEIRYDAFKETPWLKQKREEDPLVIVNGILVDGLTAKGDITVPDGVRTIAENAFSDISFFFADDWRKEGAYNDGLTSVTLPSSVKEIKSQAFLNCIALRSINLPEGLTEISGDAFARCAMTEITIPSSVRIIELRAFQDSSLRKVVLPEGLQMIASEAFMGCANLTEISIPESVSVFGSSVFKVTPWMEQKQAEDPCVVVNHILLDGSACSGPVVIPDGVIRINDEAFLYNKHITSVEIPDTVTSIGEEAFNGCTMLKEAVIPGSVKLLDRCAFSDCTELTSVTLQNGVESLRESAFYGCAKLTSVSIPESVREIGCYVFTDTAWLSQMRNQTQLVIVNGILVDGINCSGSVTIPDSVKMAAPCAFQENKNLIDVTIPDGFTAISEGMFSGCSGLKSVTIPDGVTEIKDTAFWGCSSLQSLVLPDSVISIGGTAFGQCVSLTDLTLSRNLKSIGYTAFLCCEALDTLTVPESVTDIARNAFDTFMTFHGKAGSEAERYAAEYGFDFVAE